MEDETTGLDAELRTTWRRLHALIETVAIAFAGLCLLVAGGVAFALLFLP